MSTFSSCAFYFTLLFLFLSVVCVCVCVWLSVIVSCVLVVELLLLKKEKQKKKREERKDLPQRCEEMKIENIFVTSLSSLLNAMIETTESYKYLAAISFLCQRKTVEGLSPYNLLYKWVKETKKIHHDCNLQSQVWRRGGEEDGAETKKCQRK